LLKSYKIAFKSSEINVEKITSINPHYEIKRSFS